MLTGLSFTFGGSAVPRDSPLFYPANLPHIYPMNLPHGRPRARPSHGAGAPLRPAPLCGGDRRPGAFGGFVGPASAPVVSVSYTPGRHATPRSPESGAAGAGRT